MKFYPYEMGGGGGGGKSFSHAEGGGGGVAHNLLAIFKRGRKKFALFQDRVVLRFVV